MKKTSPNTCCLPSMLLARLLKAPSDQFTGFPTANTFFLSVCTVTVKESHKDALLRACDPTVVLYL